MAPLLSLLLLVGLLARLVAGSVHGNYSVQVLADAPAVYYPLNETAGGGGVYAADYSGNARHGAYNSSLLGTAGLYFRAPLTLYPALSMNQSSVGFTSTLVSFVHSRAQLADYASFSLEVWMAAIAAQSAQLVSLGGSAAASTQTDAAVSIASSGSVTCACNVSHALTAVTAVAHTPFDGKPHHIVCTYNASSSELALYIDGQLSSNRTAGPRTVAGPLFLRVGGDQYRSQGFFSGVLGSVALYNRSLSSARLLSHYQTAVNGSSSLNYSSLFAPPRSLPRLHARPHSVSQPSRAGRLHLLCVRQRLVAARVQSAHAHHRRRDRHRAQLHRLQLRLHSAAAAQRDVAGRQHRQLADQPRLQRPQRQQQQVGQQPAHPAARSSQVRGGHQLHRGGRVRYGAAAVRVRRRAGGGRSSAQRPVRVLLPGGLQRHVQQQLSVHHRSRRPSSRHLHRSRSPAARHARSVAGQRAHSALSSVGAAASCSTRSSPRPTTPSTCSAPTSASTASICTARSTSCCGFKAANVPGVTVVNNVKLLSSATNTDALTYCGPANGVIVNDSFILSNDNQIVLGGCGGAEPVGPYNNLIAASTFIKFNHAGNWLFLQGDNNGNGGEIGANNTITNCDIVRMDRELGLIVQTYGYPRGINNVTLDRLRLWSYNDTTQQTAGGSLLLLNTTDQLAHRSLTLSNFDIPNRPAQLRHQRQLAALLRQHDSPQAAARQQQSAQPAHRRSLLHHFQPRRSSIGLHSPRLVASGPSHCRTAGSSSLSGSVVFVLGVYVTLFDSYQLSTCCPRHVRRRVGWLLKLELRRLTQFVREKHYQ